MNSITADTIRELLRYDLDSGIFYWKERPAKFFPDEAHQRTWNKRFTGKIAGNIASNGYCYINIEPKAYLAHRLAWLYVYGEWPKKNLDHINRNRSDNRIINLREANHAENGQNLKERKNASGFTGVSWHGQRKRWVAKIMVNYKNIHIGLEGKCYWCRKKMQLNPLTTTESGSVCTNNKYATFEHILPRANGGTREKSNIVLAHACCNRKRARRKWEHDPYRDYWKHDGSLDYEKAFASRPSEESYVPSGAG